MDEREHEYLRQQIRELERARTRWKIATVCLLTAFALFLVLGLGSFFTHEMLSLRTQTQRARAAEQEARMAAEDARLQAVKAEQQAREVLDKAALNQNGKELAPPKGGTEQKKPEKQQ